MAGRLEGKMALITGAGCQGSGWGNGKATAVLFAREGAEVVAVDRDEDAAKATCELIEQEGGRCHVLVGNVATEDSVKEIVEATYRIRHRIDILHNNVGIGSVGGPTEIDKEEWDKVFSVNVTSMYLTCRYVLPIMEMQSAGSIVNISSIGGIRDIGVPYSAYAASKAAVNQLSQSIAIQYAAKGIRCNTVSPGLMNTPMVHNALGGLYNNVEDLIASRDARCPTGKMGTGWDIAYASLFLASEEARYVNAHNLVVDGGITATIR